MKILYLLLMISFVFLHAQIKVVSVEKLPVPKTEHWSNVQFSPSGQELYLTNTDYNGIWQFSLTTKLLKEITGDRHSGYNFTVSNDGSTIAYRRTVVEGDHTSRIQESVQLDLKTLNQSVIERGNSIATPVFVNDKSQSQKIYRSKLIVEQSAIQILGIEDTKIALLRNGLKTLFDPLLGGQYIWPILSPDKTKLIAVEMDRGAFISDLDGKNIVRLGKCNAPQWTRDGKWIIGMDDKDDGHNIISSDLIAVSTDGKTRIQLTNTTSLMEMFPAVSPIENIIVVSTSSGELLMLSYEEGQ